MGLGYVVDQLHDQYRLANSGTAKQPYKIKKIIQELCIL